MNFESKFCSRDRSALDEATRSPIFLFQKRIWQIIAIPDGYEFEDGTAYQTLEGYVDDQIDEWNSNKTTKVALHDFLKWTQMEYGTFVQNGTIPDRVQDEWEPKILSEEQLADIPYGDWDVPCALSHWETQRVYLTREEANAFGEAKHYNYPDGWRVYCVCAEGELGAALKDGTEMTLKLGQ